MMHPLIIFRFALIAVAIGQLYGINSGFYLDVCGAGIGF